MYKTIFLKPFVYIFKVQAATAAKTVLDHYYETVEIEEILNSYWVIYLQEKLSIKAQPTLGGTLMVHLSGMSIAFYRELISKGHSKEMATQIFYNIAWKVYVKMGKLSWWLSGRGNRYNHLLRATQLFRKFPFNSPSYVWEEVETRTPTVSFNCVKCPVADYFKSKNLSELCVNTWCALDFPLAEMWDAKLERTGSIAGGAKNCDFCWTPKVHVALS